MTKNNKSIVCLSCPTSLAFLPPCRKGRYVTALQGRFLTAAACDAAPSERIELGYYVSRAKMMFAKLACSMKDAMFNLQDLHVYCCQASTSTSFQKWLVTRISSSLPLRRLVLRAEKGIEKSNVPSDMG